MAEPKLTTDLVEHYIKHPVGCNCCPNCSKVHKLASQVAHVLRTGTLPPKTPKP